MSDQIKTQPLSSNPVEAAIHAGKIPESRREHYNAEFARDPEGTRRVLDRLEAVLAPPLPSRADLHAQRIGVTAVDLDDASSAYPREWFAGHFPDPSDPVIVADD